MPTEVCPSCGVQLGEPGGPDVIGHEVQVFYDGILFWSCQACRYAWPRFTGDGPRSEQATRAAEWWNAEIWRGPRQEPE